MPSPAPVPKTAVVVWTQRTNLQKNAQWRNAKSCEENIDKRKKATNTKAIVRRKNAIAEKIAAGIAVTKAEQAKVQDTSIVGLNHVDLGPIFFGKLSKDGYAAIAGSEPLWTSYFVSPVAEEIEEKPAESGIDKSNIENYLHDENEDISDIIDYQGCLLRTHSSNS